MLTDRLQKGEIFRTEEAVAGMFIEIEHTLDRVLGHQGHDHVAAPVAADWGDQKGRLSVAHQWLAR